MADKDALVIGTGLQGLSAALLLARAGAKVTLMEGPAPAMGARADDEFYEGFALGACPHPPISVSMSLLRKLGITDLANKGHIIHLSIGGEEETLVLPLTPQQAADIFGENPSLYEKFWQTLGQVALVISSALKGTPSHQSRSWQEIWQVYGTAAQLAGQPDNVQQAFADLFRLSVVDYVAQNLSSPDYQQTLVSEVAFDLQSNPLAPGSAAGLLDLAWQSLGGLVLRTGVESLRARLKQLCVEAGVADMTGLMPLNMIVEQGFVRGVKTTEGQEIRSARILSDIPAPSLVLDLLPQGSVPMDLRIRIENEANQSPYVRVKIAFKNWPQSLRDDPALQQTGYRMIGLDATAIAKAYGEARSEGGSTDALLHLALVEPMDADTRPMLSLLGAYISPELPRTQQNRLAAAKGVMSKLMQSYADLEPELDGFSVFLGEEIERIFGVQPRIAAKGGSGFSALLSQAQFWHRLQEGHGLQNLYVLGQGPESVISCFHTRDAERIATNVLSDLAL